MSILPKRRLCDSQGLFDTLGAGRAGLEVPGVMQHVEQARLQKPFSEESAPDLDS